MLRTLWRLVLLIIIAAGFAWLADRPGKVHINWMGRDIEMSVLVGVALLVAAFVLLSMLYGALRRIWRSPSTAREFWRFRRTQKGYSSLSKGIIAANAGDAQAASKHASIASNTLTDEPLLNVLTAQAAQLRGDREAVKRAFEDMSNKPETAVLGLRGLFNEARQAGDLTAAIGHAEKALAQNPRLAWASSAVLQIQSAKKDWTAAALTLASQGKSGLLPKEEANKKRAIVLTAQALDAEGKDRDKALSLATEAHGLDASLVPAALVAARAHIANGSTRKAVRVISDCWKQHPHPDLAEVLSQAKPGDSAEERYERIRDLVGDTTSDLEGAFALARSAIAARRFEAAKQLLAPHITDQPQARICALMAEIETAAANQGHAREWLARALTAPRDPLWVADGVASPRWVAVSPVTGEIVACEWKPPYDMAPSAALPSFTPEAGATKPVAQITSSATSPTTENRVLPTVRPDDPGVASD